MTDEILAESLRQYIAASSGPQVDVVWQGGEPLLVGLEFFRRAVALEKALLPPGWTCTNAIQTNGTLLDDAWCRFFREESFLVGISLDGPAPLHDAYRVDRGGGATHARVMQGLRLLQRYGVEYNVLCVVHNANAGNPLDVYQFFKESGVNWLQFIPLVEHLGDGTVSVRSVSADQYGAFLTTVFDEWVRHDVGRVFVQLFEECLAVWCGYSPQLCVLARTCGTALVVEHNGDIYACDHFVEPGYLRGNIRSVSLEQVVKSPEQVRFGLKKRDGLPQYCRKCEVRFICNGGCPRNRFVVTPEGELGLNYLCNGYRRFFRHIDPYMRRMAALWHHGCSPALIMKELKG